MIVNSGMVANMVAAPQDDVVSNRNKRLHNIVFEDETVFAYFAISPDEGVGTDVRSWRVPLLLGRGIKPFPELILLRIHMSREKTVSGWFEALMNCLEWNHRKTEKRFAL